MHIEIGTNYHNKNFALSLALKEKVRGTRKWPIAPRCCFTFSFSMRMLAKFCFVYNEKYKILVNEVQSLTAKFRGMHTVCCIFT